MVTGIEAAGLALGIFPLVIEGIKFYINFAKKAKQLKHHKHTLDKFRREIVMEKSKFDNTWCTLASRAGVYIEPNMKPPLTTTERVLSCLPEHAVESFIGGCQELNTIMGQLREKFRKYEQNSAEYLKILTMFRHFTPEDCEEYIERIFRLNFNLDKLVNGAPPTAAVEANKRHKVNVARHYQRVRKHATTLYSTLREKLQLESCHCPVSVDGKIPHSANLQLDMFILGTQYISHNDVPTMGRLSLLFPVPAEQTKTEGCLTLRELEFESLDNSDSEEKCSSDEKIRECPNIDIWEPGERSVSSLHETTDQDPSTLQPGAEYTASKQKTEPTKHSLSISSPLAYVSNILRPRSPFKKAQKKVGFSLPEETPPPCAKSPPVPSAPAKIIECFCSTIQSIKEIRSCVGILVGNNSKHQVWAPMAPLAMLASARTVSLAEMLSLPEPPTRRERLKLGVRLASSVLQFHKTEWLQERWGKQDIYLIQGDSSQSGSPSLETPVVCQAFTPKPSVSEAFTESNIISCSLSLFSLGIVLIELWFWRSVESFQANTPDTYDSLEDLDTARFITARKLIKSLYGDAGDDYGDIVRRCINGLDHKETQLENDEFKNEVYLKVLQPLEKHLELFCSESVGNIFKKWSS